MPKTPAHPLDKLFRSKLRDISWKQFQEREKAHADLPKPWRWPEAKTGIEWTLLGRKAELWWNASPAHSIRNHSTAEHAINEAVRHGEVWHESIPGKPDVLMMWLASMREAVSNGKIQNALARALKNRPAGLGVPGDGGYLDQMISLVEREIEEGVEPERRRVIHDATSHPWLSGTLLRTIGTGAGDWRPVVRESLPETWPLATIERIFALARATQQPDRSVMSMAGSGGALVRLLALHPISGRMLELLTQDALIAGAQAQHGALPALEHYHQRGVAIDGKLLDALLAYQDKPWAQLFPRLMADAQERHLHARTTWHGQPERRRAGGRL